MLIDGEAVVEIDVRASCLTILYALNGRRLEPTTDPYDIDGLPRNVVKMWIMVTLGHNKFPQRWPSEIRKDFQKDGIEIGKSYPMRVVRDQVLKAHPVLADWPEQSVTCFDLMYLESAAVMNTMLRLMREQGVVSLSVHDSLIVPGSRSDVASRVLRHEYRRAVGVLPTLRID